MKKFAFCLLGLMVVIPLLVGNCTAAQEKTIKLMIYSWNVPKDPSTKALEQIAIDLKEATEGQVTADITFQSLGGPKDAYDVALKGLADIVYVSMPYTPGRFPFTDMLGLPIYFPDNTIAGKAHYELLKRGYLDKQFADVHVLSVGGCSPYIFYWGKKIDPAKTLHAFKGRKISASGGPWAGLVKALDAVPVGGLAAPDCYLALETGVVDAVLNLWAMVPVFKIHEISSHITNMSLCCFGNGIVINKKSYKKLPKKAKAVLDKNVEKYSLMQTAGFTNFNNVGKKIFLESGGTIHTLSETDTARMRERLKPIFDKWVDDMEARGLPGRNALDELYTILQDLGVKEPFAR